MSDDSNIENIKDYINLSYISVVESKIENRKKKRAFRSAVSLELDMEKHVLRQMKGRRLDELSPGEYRGTKNTMKPVVVEGHWEEPTAEEQQKHDTVHKLQVWG